MKRAAVLVVDDDRDIRTLVLELLRVGGHRGEGIPSGVEALVRLAHHPRPDVVLLDVQMPELDGWDTLRAIRNDLRLVNLPVILCTVKASVDDVALGWEIGCDAYLRKPFGIVELLEQVEEVVGRPPADRRPHRAAMLAATRACLPA